MEFARLRQEIHDTDRRLSSVQSQVSSRAANEGKFAECSSEIASLRQEVGNTDRKLSSAMFKVVRRSTFGLRMVGDLVATGIQAGQPRLPARLVCSEGRPTGRVLHGAIPSCQIHTSTVSQKPQKGKKIVR